MGLPGGGWIKLEAGFWFVPKCPQLDHPWGQRGRPSPPTPPDPPVPYLVCTKPPLATPPSPRSPSAPPWWLPPCFPSRRGNINRDGARLMVPCALCQEAAGAGLPLGNRAGILGRYQDGAAWCCSIPEQPRCHCPPPRSRGAPPAPAPSPAPPVGSIGALATAQAPREAGAGGRTRPRAEGTKNTAENSALAKEQNNSLFRRGRTI